MATRSDALLAAVKAGEVKSQLLGARSRARIARRALAVLLGAPADTAFVLPDSLDQPVEVHREWPAGRTAGRSDVLAAAYARDAAEVDVLRRTALYLPRVNSFGRVDWNTPGTPFGGRSSWTLGLMLSWSPFSGAGELASVRAGKARRATARAMAEAAAAKAELEAAQSRDNLSLALDRLEIARQAVQQAEEAHRIVSRKYDGGLATVTELFEAAAAETASRLSRAAAQYDALVARAELEASSGAEVSSTGNP
jgi:outer membrane protein TolC